MTSSRYRTSSVDGLVARVSGDWAEDKLTYLEKYMDAFATSMRRKFNTVYIDLLAGSGRCIEADGREFDGSPLRALNLKRPFKEVIFIEGDPDLAAALRQRVGTPNNQQATLIVGDCNDPAVIKKVGRRLDRKSLALAFVDNLGLTVPFETLRQLKAGHRVDLFVTFMTSDLKRNRSAAFSGDDAERWTRYFGSREWEEIVEGCLRANRPAEETAVALMDHYEDRLRTLGYRYFARSRRGMRTAQNVELYRLLLASENDLAIKLFDGISKIEPDGQRGLAF